MNLTNILYVFLGGGIGSVLRFVLSLWTINQNEIKFPIATLLVNVCGSLLMGAAFAFVTKTVGLNHPLRFLLIVGFCGGFTTFSTFALENMNFLKSGAYGILISNVLLSNILCVLAVYLGFKLTNQ